MIYPIRICMKCFVNYILPYVVYIKIRCLRKLLLQWWSSTIKNKDKNKTYTIALTAIPMGPVRIAAADIICYDSILRALIYIHFH